MTLHIFNPEHDMALAANSKHWTSPHAGRQLRAELGWIPALWAKDGDVVLVDDVDAAENEYFRFKSYKQKANVIFISVDELSRIEGIDSVIPWGWDKSLCAQLYRNGISETLLPTEDTLSDIRCLSGRQITLSMMPFLRKGYEDETCGEVKVITSVDELEAARTEWGSVVVKSPWSCSGRGVHYLPEDESLTENFLNWFSKSLRQQKEMVVEPYFESVTDFGMEFEIVNGISEYRGLSLFDTANGAYTGSLLATEEEKRKMLESYVSHDIVEYLKNRICNFIDTKNKGAYNGAFGVDMMIVRKSDKLLLNPCVELNFRRTMGHTALALSPEQEGNKKIMRIAYEGKHYHIRLFNNENWLY